jgi:cytochrome c
MGDLSVKLFLPAAAALTLTGATSVAAQSAPQPDGAALFRTRCASCHTVTPGARTTVGPNLSGIVGRKAASTTFSYSTALKASNITWTRANLERYLSGPTRMVPGTRMVIAVSDAAQRAALLNYLARPTR